MNPLVSIITPCYNGETFVHRLLDSILTQTYRPVEFIAVDDGSTDRTVEVLESYRLRFEKEGISFLLLRQSNSGPAAALSHGLSHYRGELVTWPDSDDFYSESRSLEKMVNAYNQLPAEYGLIRTNAWLIRESDLAKVGRICRSRRYTAREELFDDCIRENHFWFTPGCYLTARRILEKVMPDYAIFPSRCGQNWQMYLPVLWTYKCKTIDEPLFSYLLRANSVCRIGRQRRSYDYLLDRCCDYEQTLSHTLGRIGMCDPDRQSYNRLVEQKSIRRRMDLAVQYSRIPDYKRLYHTLKQQRVLRIGDRMASVFKSQSLLYRICKKIEQICRDTFN